MKVVLIFLASIVLSMFFFPFNPPVLQGINTKLLLAGVSPFIIGWQAVIDRRLFSMPRELFVASIIALIFSMVGLFSVLYNETDDYAYAFYIVSMWVWLGAAYVACYFISRLHGYISFRLITNYLIGICVAQCILALVIEFVPTVKIFVDTYIDMGNKEFLNEINRLYGIGAALDTAGTRFACVLTIIAVALCHNEKIYLNKMTMSIYILSFLLISGIGAMIARTTTVGIVLALVYMLYELGILKNAIKQTTLNMWGFMLIFTTLLVMVTTVFYVTNAEVRELLRYGFEGFFNWVEKGTWETASTEKLQTMWVYPESLKTWLIGDGRFVDPDDAKYFYMRTDVGYLRFIFYCGVVGLSVFSCFFVYLTYACKILYPKEKQTFLLLLLLVFIIWIKVSTDIFLVYALFLCVVTSPKYLQTD